jgi:hypothetical protein
MNSLILAVAIVSTNTSMHLISKDLGYLSDTDVLNFQTECVDSGLTSFETYSTDGKVRQIKCYSQEMHEWVYVPEPS